MDYRGILTVGRDKITNNEVVRTMRNKNKLEVMNILKVWKLQCLAHVMGGEK